jgi:hypothetical protein
MDNFIRLNIVLMFPSQDLKQNIAPTNLISIHQSFKYIL